MSALSIYSETGELHQSLRDFTCIATTLSDLGIRFERWPVGADLEAEADAEAILHAYRHPVELMRRRHDFRKVEVVQNDSGTEHSLDHAHVHCDFEMLLFIEGDGLFYFHVDEKVYLLLCGKGDLVSLPSRTVHWIDMGQEPGFRCIRFFTEAEGLKTHHVSSDIAARFPGYDEFKLYLDQMWMAACPT